jgi:hypothetical protein
MANSFHEANRRRWDAGAASWAHCGDTRAIWRKCHLDPSLALHPSELDWLSDIAGICAAVLGSGDNQVAFALAGPGTRVECRYLRPADCGGRHRAAALAK